jgi:transcriptional regulator with XRE-family HTH domain
VSDFLDKMKLVGSRLADERERMLLKQPDFADLGGAKRASQSSYENGKSPFGIDYLLKLEAHGVDIGYIVTGVRAAGLADALEKSFLSDFRRLDTNGKEAVALVLVALLNARTSPPSREALLIGKVSAALADYEIPTVDQWVADIQKSGQSQSQTMHSPALDYRPKPKDDA